MDELGPSIVAPPRAVARSLLSGRSLEDQCSCGAQEEASAVAGPARELEARGAAAQCGTLEL